MTAARGKTPRATADTLDQFTDVLTRSRGCGGRAVGGRVVGRYRAGEPRRCECCRCRIRRGAFVFEVLTDNDVLEVCAECVGRQL
jgi:hypothetical protein